jgi:glycine C-acetyltransferase/8-amino-7-oxononanoate synthase
MVIHERLEKITAEFKGTEDALAFNCGYMANVGIIQALTDERDAIFSDELNHASIIDGCRLSLAKVFIYHHCNVEHLQSLQLQTSGYRKRIIITDSVFSMDGDIAPIPDILNIAEEYNAIVIVDDAHATGVLGKKGSGSFEYFGITDKNHIQMGTYSKALGSFGAYISGSKEVKDYLINKARSFIYTTALPPSVIAASIAAIKLLNEDRGIVERLNENTRLFRERLRGLGFNTLNSETPIIPILIGTVEDTISFSERLFEEGIYAAPIRPPTVPEGKCRIRTTVTAAHSISEIELCLKACEKVGKELKII